MILTTSDSELTKGRLPDDIECVDKEHVDHDGTQHHRERFQEIFKEWLTAVER